MIPKYSENHPIKKHIALEFNRKRHDNLKKYALESQFKPNTESCP